MAKDSSELPFELVAAKIDLPELQGEPEEVAREKCRLAARQAQGKIDRIDRID